LQFYSTFLKCCIMLSQRVWKFFYRIFSNLFNYNYSYLNELMYCLKKFLFTILYSMRIDLFAQGKKSSSFVNILVCFIRVYRNLAYWIIYSRFILNQYYERCFSFSQTKWECWKNFSCYHGIIIVSLYSGK